MSDAIPQLDLPVVFEKDCVVALTFHVPQLLSILLLHGAWCLPTQCARSQSRGLDFGKIQNALPINVLYNRKWAMNDKR